eukprot:COSAG06_NODE_45860_length_351_cov_1.023810_2_plen_47_part_01
MLWRLAAAAAAAAVAYYVATWIIPLRDALGVVNICEGAHQPAPFSLV